MGIIDIPCESIKIYLITHYTTVILHHKNLYFLQVHGDSVPSRVQYIVHNNLHVFSWFVSCYDFVFKFVEFFSSESFSIFFRVASLALWQCDFLSASEVTLRDVGMINWYSNLKYHNKKQTICELLGRELSFSTMWPGDSSDNNIMYCAW